MQPFTRRWSGSRPTLTAIFVALHAAAFAAQLVVQWLPGEPLVTGAWLAQFLGLSGEGIAAGRYWQFLTFPLLHDGPWPFHLLANVALLYFAGREVEPIVGPRHFFALYAIGTLAGGAFHFALMPEVPLIGVSAGVCAVMAAYATILPEFEISLNAFFVLPLRVRAKYLGAAIVAVAAALWFTSTATLIGPAGMLVGALLGWVYVKRLGFGNPLAIQRYIFRKRQRAERLERMSAEQFISAEIDPILEKIAREGMHSLTRSERKVLALGREKIAARTATK